MIEHTIDLEGGVRICLLDAERMIGGAGMGDSPILTDLAGDAGAGLALVAAALKNDIRQSK